MEKQVSKKSSGSSSKTTSTAMTTEERATRILIKRYIRERNWFLVETMFITLGRIYEKQETSNA